MKHPPHFYAAALAEVIAESKKKDSTAFAANFLAILRKNGDEAHLPKILEEAERLVRRSDGTHRVVLESARPLSDAQKKQVHQLVAGATVEEKNNPDLVAGIRIIVDDERQFDGSLKGKLDKLFG